MKKELKHKKVENKLDKRSAEEPLLIHSQLSTKKAMGDKPSFHNRSRDLCWLNVSLQLTLRALDLKSSVDLFSGLGRLIGTLRTRVPKSGYDTSNIRSLLSHGQFEHLETGQQCIVECFQLLNQKNEMIFFKFGKNGLSRKIQLRTRNFPASSKV